MYEPCYRHHVNELVLPLQPLLQQETPSFNNFQIAHIPQDLITQRQEEQEEQEEQSWYGLHWTLSPHHHMHHVFYIGEESMSWIQWLMEQEQESDYMWVMRYSPQSNQHCGTCKCLKSYPPLSSSPLPPLSPLPPQEQLPSPLPPLSPLSQKNIVEQDWQQLLENQLDHHLFTRVNRLYKRRHYLIHLARETKVFGILVATVTVSRYMDMLQRVKQWLNNHHRSHYVIYVGKLNVAKLANFSEVDMFVMIGCGHSMDFIVTTGGMQQQYLKPIITPFELHMALSIKNDNHHYHKYRFDFEHVLNIQADDTTINHPCNNEEDSFRLVSSPKVVVSYDRQVTTILQCASPALAHLQSRSYRGLGHDGSGSSSSSSNSVGGSSNSVGDC